MSRCAKRKRTAERCYLCAKNGEDCDGGRPCGNCTTRGNAHICLGLANLPTKEPCATTSNNCGSIALSSSCEIDAAQFNRFLLQELNKVRQEYNALKMDFVQLTRENERLHAINLQEGSQMPANSQLIASEEISRLRTSPSTDNISYNPPIGNANEALCMLIESQEAEIINNNPRKQYPLTENNSELYDYMINKKKAKGEPVTPLTQFYYPKGNCVNSKDCTLEMDKSIALSTYEIYPGCETNTLFNELDLSFLFA